MSNSRACSSVEERDQGQIWEKQLRVACHSGIYEISPNARLVLESRHILPVLDGQRLEKRSNDYRHGLETWLLSWIKHYDGSSGRDASDGFHVKRGLVISKYFFEEQQQKGQREKHCYISQKFSCNVPQRKPRILRHIRRLLTLRVRQSVVSVKMFPNTEKVTLNNGRNKVSHRIVLTSIDQSGKDGLIPFLGSLHEHAQRSLWT